MALYYYLWVNLKTVVAGSLVSGETLWRV